MSTKRSRPLLYLLFVFLLPLGCQQENNAIQQTIAPEDIKNKNAFLTTIQHPAGASSSHSFLPYPANHGVCQNQSSLEVLTLAPRLAANDQIAVQPIATLVLSEQGTTRHIILATPIDTALQLIKITNYQQFLVQQAGMRQIIQDWFLYEKGLGEVELEDWKDERYAWKLISN